jgi:thiol-disulfide isomerase/thioredoxin
MDTTTTFNNSDNSMKFYDIVLVFIITILLLYIIIKTMFFDNTSYINNELFSNNKNKYKVEYYYMEKCGHCVNFKPVWDEFEQYASSNNIQIEKCDITKTTSQKPLLFNINSTPTVVITQDDSVIVATFSGPRTINNLITFVNTFYNSVSM